MNRVLASVAFVLAVLSLGGRSSSVKVDPALVILGRILYVEKKDEATFEKDKAFYVHENTQRVALAVERVLSGEVVESRIVVRTRINSRGAHFVNWLNSSYGVLDSESWTKGRSLVAVLTRASDEGVVDCPLRTRAGDDSDLFYPIVVSDAGFIPYAMLDEYCAGIEDMLLLADPLEEN